MNEALYQRAKAVFNLLVNEPPDVREHRLAELQDESPQLAEEVRSLLQYHTAQSLVVPQENPRIRTRSTLTSTYQSRSWDSYRVPLLAIALTLPLLGISLALAWWIDQQVHLAVQSQVYQDLNEAVEDRKEEFLRWEHERIAEAIQWGQNPSVVSPIQSLVLKTQTLARGDTELTNLLVLAEEAEQLGKQLQVLSGNSAIEYTLWDRRMLTLADWRQESEPGVLGAFVTPEGASMLTSVLEGTPNIVLPGMGKVVSQTPAAQNALSATHRADSSDSVASLFVPIRQDSSVLAVLMVRNVGGEDGIQRLVESWPRNEAEDAYLLNQRGAFLTQSRHLELLENFPAVQDQSGRSTGILALDPGVDLLSGEKPHSPPSAWSRTLMANRVTTGNNEVNIRGYRNYVGRPVVGAWRWIDDQDIGLALEIEYDHAFGISQLVRRGIYGMALGLSLLGLLGVALLATTFRAANRRLRDVSEVGPYQIQELLGEGGMGRVYLAEHALLCRQSAIKVLNNPAEDLSVLGRFEREVQLASQLTHPNTIAIFDFGRNKDGLFYYAMEYIHGAHLGQLVEFGGPIEPGRCIFILKQLCNALQEAHQVGVVHRDIKPQNIMVCNRGGEPDFVKLFDYGLVKSFAPGISDNSTQTKIVVGTPRFMAPERLNSPWLADPRVDVYSIGALAYYLLTAQLPPLVTMDDGHDAQTGVETLDLPPDVVAFGEILSLCMAVEPAARPSSMHSLLRELDELSEKFPWTREDSLAWWRKHEAKLLLLVKNKRKELKGMQESPTLPSRKAAK